MLVELLVVIAIIGFIDKKRYRWICVFAGKRFFRENLT
jgi:hypothetical protein